MTSYSSNNIADILKFWKLEFKRFLPEADISGSPERSHFRTAIETTDGKTWLLEQITDGREAHKQRIATLLDYLHSAGTPYIHPYLTGADGNHFCTHEGRSWQVMPFIQSIPLIRPQYAFDAWRGPILADFLMELRGNSKGLPCDPPVPFFSIIGYVRDFMKRISRHHPEQAERLSPVASFIRKHLEPLHDALPTSLCHGDFHPLNIIWGDREIRGIIDWEFSGVKPENYDAAVLIGCLGMEDPDSLFGPLVESFLKRLREHDLLSAQSWLSLPEMIIAIRFGWMAEWLRKEDAEMIELETVYLNLLVEHHEVLREAWALPR